MYLSLEDVEGHTDTVVNGCMLELLLFPFEIPRFLTVASSTTVAFHIAILSSVCATASWSI